MTNWTALLPTQSATSQCRCGTALCPLKVSVSKKRLLLGDDFDLAMFSPLYACAFVMERLIETHSEKFFEKVRQIIRRSLSCQRCSYLNLLLDVVVKRLKQLVGRLWTFCGVTPQSAARLSVLEGHTLEGCRERVVI